MLFLHGYGECGTDIEKVKKHGPPKLVDNVEALSGCVMISPQCPRDCWWRVEALHAQGAFRGRSSANYVAAVLTMGRATVYKILKQMKEGG